MWSPTVAKHDHTLTARGITAGLFGGPFNCLYAASGRLVGEVGVQNDLVEAPTAQLEGLWSERHNTHRKVLVETLVEEEHWPGSGGSVVAHDGLTPEEAAHQMGEVLQLRRGDAGDPVGVLSQGNAAPKPENEASTGQALHRPGEPCRHHGMAGVVVSRGRLDPDPLACGTGSSAEGRRFLAVVALGDERGAESKVLALNDLFDDVS